MPFWVPLRCCTTVVRRRRYECRPVSRDSSAAPRIRTYASDRMSGPPDGALRQTGTVSELSEEGVVAAGGWHPRYARVLLIQRLGNEAVVVLVDGNGDGAEVEAEHWFRDEHGDWVGGGIGGVGALDGRPIWT